MWSRRYRRPKDFPVATPVQVIDEVRGNNPDAKWALTAKEHARSEPPATMLADLLALDFIVLGTLATYLSDPWVARVRESLGPRGRTRCGRTEKLAEALV